MIMMGDKKKALMAILGPKSDNVGIRGKEDNSAVQIAAQEAIEAVHSKDASAFLDAIQAIFAEFDSEPHVEGEHIEG